MWHRELWAWIFLRHASVRGLKNTLRSLILADPQLLDLDIRFYRQKIRLLRNELRRRNIEY